MFKANFSEYNKIWECTKKIWGEFGGQKRFGKKFGGAQKIWEESLLNALPCLWAWAEPLPESLLLGASC